MDTNEYVRSTADFYTALEGAGFDRIKVKNKRFIKGVRLKADDADGEDFLNWQTSGLTSIKVIYKKVS